MYKLNYKASVACAHYLQDSKSLTTKKCLNLHGHNYKIEVNIKTSSLINGMIIDFGKLKEVIDRYDHCCLNETFALENPTTEIFSELLHSNIKSELNNLGHKEYEVEVIVAESEKGSITYKD